MIKISIDKNMELEYFLKLIFKDRFDPDMSSGFDNFVHGTFDGKKLLISLTPHEGIRAASDDLEVLETITPALSYVMDDNAPICRYNAKNEPSDKISIINLEWDIKDPEKRIKDIVNGRGVGEELIIENVTPLNGRDASEYIDTEEEKMAFALEEEERRKNAKVYGIYPGIIDPEEVKNMPEYEVYLTINSLMRQKVKATILSQLGQEVDTTELDYGFAYLVYQTTRFGVELPEPEVDKGIDLTASFEAWLSFWQEHFSEFSEDQWKSFNALKESGRDISDFLPSGSWKDNYNRQMRPGEYPEDQE